MDQSNSTTTPGTPAGQQSVSGTPHIQTVSAGYQPSLQHTQQPAHPNLLSMASGAPQLDPATTSLFMHPHAAAAVAAVAAAAAQQMVQSQSGGVAPKRPVANLPPTTTAPHGQPHPAAATTPSPSPAAVPANSAQGTKSQSTVSPPPPGHSVQPTSPSQHAYPNVPPHLAALVGMGAPPQPAPAPPPAQTIAYPPVPPQTTPIPHLPHTLPTNPAAVAAAAAQVVAAHAAAASASSGAMTNALLANMQNWKLEQLEAHVQLLRDANQPIPQPVAMLLADARRKEEKRTAKRVANRKSACTSRARKKALVEEMTRTNARLKRQALILALLPDLVIAITVEGEITFCSAQVERVLRYKIDDLIGANLSDILVPASREALRHLVQELVAAERAASTVVVQGGNENRPNAERASVQNESKEDNGNGNGNGNGSAQSSNGSGISSANGAAVVSDQSFPLSVVKVESQQSSGAEENSDLSTSNSGGKTIVPTPTATNSVPPSPEDEAIAQGTERPDVKSAASTQETQKKQGQRQSSSDESFSSSSDAKNLRKANENLSRNVRWHNEKMLSKKSKTNTSKKEHKDDVTGASVTPNNADARLSSLQHRPERPSPKKKPRGPTGRFESLEEQSSSSSDSLLAGVEEKKKAQQKTGHENCSDDSGYRESNESAREDTSSSASDSSNGRRAKPLAPTCNVCLIRDDLTTIWCEVTSSIRTRSLKEESVDTATTTHGKVAQTGSKASAMTTNHTAESSLSTKDEIKELLLCLRPIRDGEEKVDETLRFVPSNAAAAAAEADCEAAVTSTATSSNGNESNSGESEEVKRPMKKRPLVQQDATKAPTNDTSQDAGKHPDKKLKSDHDEDPERSVVESLMLMSHKTTTPKAR